MGMSKKIEYETNDKGCMLVTSHMKNKDGYIRVTRKGKQVFLHRYMYEQKFGKIEDGLVTRHKCDNRSCINVDNLELGTQKDNICDMFERGRYNNPSTKGEYNGRAIITEDDVINILKDKTSTNKDLAKIYKVHHATISAIRKRKTWKHVNLPD